MYIFLAKLILHTPSDTHAIKTANDLKSAGFTESGITRYDNTIKSFCEDLFNKAIALGDRDKASDAPREVTHEHVRDATTVLSSKNKDGQGTLQIICQIGEYTCTAAAGVGCSNLNQKWGTILFGVSLCIGIALFVFRNTRGK